MSYDSQMNPGNSAMIAGNSSEELIRRDAVDRYGRPTADPVSVREPVDRSYGAGADPMAIHIWDAERRDYNSAGAPHVSILAFFFHSLPCVLNFLSNTLATMAGLIFHVSTVEGRGGQNFDVTCYSLCCA